MDDRKTLDQLLEWTRWNLQQGDPARLPGWLWGKRKDGSWGAIDPEPASDADQWMAWALILAGERWNESAYITQAVGLLNNIWENEVKEIGGDRYILPGPWAMHGDPVVLNPSYSLPFAWREFARVDPEHDWAGLIGPAYSLYEELMAGGRLPPDWVLVDPESRAVVGHPSQWENSEHFGFEAFRVAWTLAAEVAWHDEPRALSLLAPFNSLRARWHEHGNVPAVLTVEGEPVVEYEYAGLYGALLPAWGQSSPAYAAQLYSDAIEPRWKRGRWGDRDDYYSQNWVWFGIALWTTGPSLLPERP
jgi:endoglucanase